MLTDVYKKIFKKSLWESQSAEIMTSPKHREYIVYIKHEKAQKPTKKIQYPSMYLYN